MEQDEQTMVTHVGPVVIDWPKSIGFYGGLALAVAFELVEPPLALFVALYPLFKMLNRPNAPAPVQIISGILQGAAKPVGGDAEGTIRVESPEPGAGAESGDEDEGPDPQAAPRRRSGPQQQGRQVTQAARQEARDDERHATRARRPRTGRTGAAESKTPSTRARTGTKRARLAA